MARIRTGTAQRQEPTSAHGPEDGFKDRADTRGRGFEEDAEGTGRSVQGYRKSAVQCRLE